MMDKFDPITTIEDFMQKAGYGGEYESEMRPIGEVLQEALLLYGKKIIELESRIEALEQSDKVMEDENDGNTN